MKGEFEMELAVNNISKKYPNKHALKNVNLLFTNGIYGILGANGSGKTTLMKIITTLLKPTEGSITYNGQDILNTGENYRNILGYLPQQVGLYKNFTAKKFLLYTAALKGIVDQSAETKVDELLLLVGLKEQENSKIGNFSGGMKQRVGIAQALLNDPKILIVDEPTAGLDPKERIRFRNLLSSLSADRIVLLSTHIVSDIEYIAKEIIVMKEGEVLQKNSPSLLLEEIREKVWIIEAPHEKLNYYEENFKVVNIIQKKENIALRIISSESPGSHAHLTSPNLEDLYLYHFD